MKILDWRMIWIPDSPSSEDIQGRFELLGIWYMEDDLYKNLKKTGKSVCIRAAKHSYHRPPTPTSKPATEIEKWLGIKPPTALPAGAVH